MNITKFVALSAEEITTIDGGINYIGHGTIKVVQLPEKVRIAIGIINCFKGF